MAKVFLASFLAAVVIVATHGIPVPRAIDWSAVSAKVHEIQVSVLNDNIDRINTVARNDNPDVNIPYEVNYIASHIRERIRQMEFEITSQRLTKSSAGQNLNNVRRELQTLTDILSRPEFLPKLSEKAIEQIKAIFRNINTSLSEKQGELNAILDVVAPKETDWTAVSAKIQEIQVSVINAGFDQIKTVAFNDNPTIPIANEVDYIARNIRESIRQMKLQATIQRLTKTLVYYYLSSVKWEIVDLIETLSRPEFLPQLSEEAVEEINSLFTTIDSGLSEKQGELYDIVPVV